MVKIRIKKQRWEILFHNAEGETNAESFMENTPV
jgi:hypothetical protein